MEVSNTPEKVLKASNPFQKAYDWSQYEIHSQETITVKFMYGFQPSLTVNPALSRWVPPDKGHLRLDETFNLANQKSQERMYGVCQILKGRTDRFTNQFCSMNGFKPFVEAMGL